MGAQFKVRSNSLDNRGPRWRCFINSPCRYERSALEAAAALGGDGMLPFYTMLEGDKDGAFGVSETISLIQGGFPALKQSYIFNLTFNC